VGVVTILGPFLVDTELTPKQDLKLQFGGECSLECLTEHEATESDAIGTGAEVVSSNGPQRLRKTRAFAVFGGGVDLARLASRARPTLGHFWWRRRKALHFQIGIAAPP